MLEKAVKRLSDRASTTINAIRLHADDHVAVLILDVAAGEEIVLSHAEPSPTRANQSLPYGHKVALRAIQLGAAVIKYGERMGIATAPIAAGDHVHVHNVRGLLTEERK